MNRSILYISALIALLAIRGSWAHPHMFIDVMAKFMLSDDVLRGINMFWDFDEMNSAMLMEDFDVNNNNRIDPDESNSIFENAFSAAASSNYFTVITWNSKALKIRKLERFQVAVQPDSRLRYSFFIPCDVPIDDIIAGGELSVFFSDPSLFVAFTIKKEMIQVSRSDRVSGAINFRKVDNMDQVVLTVSRSES